MGAWRGHVLPVLYREPWSQQAAWRFTHRGCRLCHLRRSRAAWCRWVRQQVAPLPSCLHWAATSPGPGPAALPHRQSPRSVPLLKLQSACPPGCRCLRDLAWLEHSEPRAVLLQFLLFVLAFGNEQWGLQHRREQLWVWDPCGRASASSSAARFQPLWFTGMCCLLTGFTDMHCFVGTFFLTKTQLTPRRAARAFVFPTGGSEFPCREKTSGSVVTQRAF